ncbi:MAG: ribosome small subunit-dependent GTPase A [Coriobacteriia bacterium]|nr:ribosome small subunit-dependent GTPase A [Coriobacteriia bacterium]
MQKSLLIEKLAGKTQCGIVVSLDRGYPLVRTQHGEERAQHSIALVKNTSSRAAVGDIVELSKEPGQDMLSITAIQPRASILARRELVESIHDGAGKTKEQILAANFDYVVVVQSLGKKRLELDYLERQLVMANESNVETLVLLTKKDTACCLDEDLAAAHTAAPGCKVLCMSKHEPLDDVTSYFYSERLGVLVGRSGVGKSTLVNMLAKEDRQAVGSVRAKDSAGRHTTVARRLVDLPGGGAVIDTPGMRAIGVLGAELGLARTFPELTAVSADCYYRNCTHTHEPGCAAIAAVEAGHINNRRLASYRTLASEVFD